MDFISEAKLRSVYVYLMWLCLVNRREEKRREAKETTNKTKRKSGDLSAPIKKEKLFTVICFDFHINFTQFTQNE